LFQYWPRYAFPKVKLPKAIDEVAKMNKKQPDEFYCLAMLGETGIMAVPGTGFNQKEGTFHFRTSPPLSLSHTHPPRINASYFKKYYYYLVGLVLPRQSRPAIMTHSWLAAHQ